MNYQESLSFLQDLCKFGINLGLERIQNLLKLLDNPEDKLSIIHIGGTNGKGSTSSFLASILKEAGLKVGVFTSPHLHTYRERIRINDELISEEEFAREMSKMRDLIPQVMEKTEESPTEFEILTAIALDYFQEAKVDLVILEVGMGGRLDSTNVIEPLISTIVPISMDHTDHLGDSIEEISREKAGIFKESRPVVLAKQEDPEALRVFYIKAEDLNCPIYNTGYFSRKILEQTDSRQIFNIKTEHDCYKNLEIKLLGEHQIVNASTAIGIAETLKILDYKISKENIYQGLLKTSWPGRMEIMAKKPTIVLDGAHNVSGIESLTRALKYSFNYEKVIFLIGILEDKDREHMLDYLMEVGDSFIVTKPLSKRAGSSKKMLETLKKNKKEVYYSEDIKEAINYARLKAKDEDLICITGSLYLIGAARDILLDKE